MAISILNAKSDVLRTLTALSANVSAAKGLQDVLKSNLGPRGTMKMLVGGGGQIKLTKDGNVLLHEMQFQHPTAAMIARASTAQDDMTGDGTTTNVLVIGELMKLSEKYIVDGVHPRILCDGFDLARSEVFRILDELKVPFTGDLLSNREVLFNVARTSLRTKLTEKMADSLTEIVVDAVGTIYNPEKALDLFMVEVLHMKHRLVNDTRLVRGMVLDHGCRHPDMPKSLRNCYILTCNVSLEYEKSEVNSGFFYSNADMRERLVEAEREFTDNKVRKILELKRLLCTPENKRTMIVLNLKGIDPPALDMLAKEGIMALRRIKRRNMERLTLCCGGNAVNSLNNLTEADLGYAGLVYEEVLGEDKFTFVEDVKNPSSCSILIKGPNDHSIAQIKDAIRDGLRAVKNVIEDKSLLPGAGAFEIAAYSKLQHFKKTISGKQKLGVEVFAESLLIVPKILAENSGLDSQDCLLKLLEEYEKNEIPVGLDIFTGDPISPSVAGIWDNYRVKRQLFSIAPALAEQFLLVDEVIKAGKSMGGGGQ
ncbi:putative TCP-1 chaperonin [Cardiosporidium cionae]|uniref:TCP-1 chaperonin n=1 Tax=Cardiosporidium cionae TaxID=476202 RepID=A0ABQ7JCM4_9APIC|nr:putative TCP-1 chaperonin [Cardiosporidium cionae]|eukprot:KAF8821781.1 putative TCP-1 chaperonin [Cardiosporidium cionae]